MKKVVIVFIVVLAGIGGWIYIKNGSIITTPLPSTDSKQTGMYKNTQYGFEVTLPSGFLSREISAENSQTILFENPNGNGVQIIISPYDDINELTADMIKDSIPDLKITDVEEVEVGQNHKGVAFVSDNPSFDGSSREVWFVFKSNLYQISTYLRLDDVLQEIFATWEFM